MKELINKYFAKIFKILTIYFIFIEIRENL